MKEVLIAAKRKMSKSEVDVFDIADKTRSNLFKWNGQFSPQFVDALIEKYGKGCKNIFDPFCGSGTVLVEAARHTKSAAGTEINPAAVFIARLYVFCNYSNEERAKHIRAVDKWINDDLLDDLPLFQSERRIKNRIFYENALQEKLKKTRIAEQKILIQAIITLLDIYFDKNLTSKYISSNWEKIKDVVSCLPFSTAKVDCVNNDCRESGFCDNEFDLLITSPPYINVFNYHQQYRRSVELMDYDLLKIAKSEFGANRKFRSNRFYTVIQYCIDMSQCIAEASRVLKTGSRMIFVVGRKSKIRSVDIFNGELVAAIGVIGNKLKIEEVKERKFKNRFGELIYEDIIVFENNNKYEIDFDESRKIALAALASSVDSTDNEIIKNEIFQAIECSSDIKPSPIYKR